MVTDRILIVEHSWPICIAALNIPGNILAPRLAHAQTEVQIQPVVDYRPGFGFGFCRVVVGNSPGAVTAILRRPSFGV